MEVDITNLRMDQAAANGSGSASGSRDSIDSSDTYSKYGITNIPKTTVVTPIGQVNLSSHAWRNCHFHFIKYIRYIMLFILYPHSDCQKR